MIKHDEDCPKQEAEFPCCEDQMCACDRDAFEILKAENSRYREALELALELAENGLVDFKKYGLNNDKDIVKKYRKALKGFE